MSTKYGSGSELTNHVQVTSTYKYSKHQSKGQTLTDLPGETLGTEVGLPVGGSPKHSHATGLFVGFLLGKPVGIPVIGEGAFVGGEVGLGVSGSLHGTSAPCVHTQGSYCIDYV